MPFANSDNTVADLIVIQGPDSGKRLPLRSVLNVGRSPQADIRTSDRRDPDTVAEIEDADGGFFLRPRGLVELNGRPSRGSPLQHGDLIQVGDTIIFFSEDLGGSDRGMPLEIGSAPDLPQRDVQARV